MRTVSVKKIVTSLFLALTIALSTVNFGCEATPKVSELTVSVMPSKVLYVVGEDFDEEGGELKAVYSDGKEGLIPMTDIDVDIAYPDTATEGTKTVKVTYLGGSVEFNIKVVSIKNVEIVKQPTKTVYFRGQPISKIGGELKVTFSDDTTKIVKFTDEDLTFSTEKFTDIGAQKVTVDFFGKVAEYSVNVKEAIAIKPVVKVDWKVKPQLSYFAGEAFNPEGGSVTVLFEDKTKEVIPLTDDRVTIADIDMGEETATESFLRTLKVSVGGKKAPQLNIGVSAIGGIVTYNYGYDGAESSKVKIAKGEAPKEPTAPTREGYTFYKWFEDSNRTVEYEFDSNKRIKGDFTLYAEWKQNGATYHVVTFKYNYYGLKVNTFAQIVKSGDKPRVLKSPTRDEFTFSGWKNTDASAFDENAAISADKEVLASWTKAKTKSEYVFEAENTDLTGKSGPGYSGQSNDGGLVVDKASLGASSGSAVSYMYKRGCSLEFYIASSEAATAKFILRLAAEDNILDMTLTQANYTILVNGTKIDYTISLKSGAPFLDADLGTINLKEGANVIQLITNNDDNPTGVAGNGTYEGTAPMIDCIKIKDTQAVLMWDGNFGLPKYW